MKKYYCQLKTGIIIESKEEFHYNDKLNCSVSKAIITCNGIMLAKHAEDVSFNLDDTILHWSKDSDKI